MKKIVQFVVFAIAVLVVFFLGSPMAWTHEVPKKEVFSYNLSSIGSWVSLNDPNQAFPYFFLRVESASKSATDVPAVTSLWLNMQIYGNCSVKSCDTIVVTAEIPAESYGADEVARTAHLVLNLTDPGVKFIYGTQYFQDGTYESLDDFPAFLEDSADLTWHIPPELKNPASGNAVLTFTDLCGGKGRTNASNLDGNAQMRGYAFGYETSSFGGGYLSFRKETTTTRSGCGQVTMPQIVFGYGGRGVGSLHRRTDQEQHQQSTPGRANHHAARGFFY